MKLCSYNFLIKACIWYKELLGNTTRIMDMIINLSAHKNVDKIVSLIVDTAFILTGDKLRHAKAQLDSV